MTHPHPLHQSRRDVLDLSLRNPLLNFNPSKRRGLEVVDELSREIFRILVGDDGSCTSSPRRRTRRLRNPSPPGEAPSDVPAELLALLAQPAADANGPSARRWFSSPSGSPSRAYARA